MVTHILKATGATVGFTSTGGVYVNDERLMAGDASGPRSARMVLRDPTVDVAVLETARGGILREGLAFQECDVATVLNVSADHLGLKGIDTLEDLAWVKSIVLEVVRRDGCSVLNADDAATVSMARRARGHLAYFSLRGGPDMPAFLREHIDAGGLAVVREPGPGGEEVIAVYDRGDRFRLMRVSAIPATLGGAAEFNVANALAAVAMTYSRGIALAKICNALSSFSTSFEQNPGRLNIYDGHGFRIIMDYAHNPAGLRALCEMMTRLRGKHRRMIGMISIPGDRRDEDICEMGAIGAQHFDELVFREKPDARGRAPGVVMELLTEGALKANFPRERIHHTPDEHGAMELCMRLAKEGDMVLLTPTDYERMWQSMMAYRAAKE
jgi:cyanophycin synthetase